MDELESYIWSSFPDCLKGSSQIVNIEFILNFFKSKGAYKSFVFEQADYQRKLKEIEHLLLENS